MPEISQSELIYDIKIYSLCHDTHRLWSNQKPI